MTYEWFSITVFLCFIVLIMLLLFLGYHTFLIYKDRTTNEQIKRTGWYAVFKNRLDFLWKWELAKEEKKAFRPTAKSIDKYSRSGDLRQDMTFEEVRVVR